MKKGERRLTNKKKNKPAQRRVGHKRNKRKNPVFSNPPGLDFLTEAIGNMSVTASLLGCTFKEKMIIAAFIPTAVEFLRTILKEDGSEVIPTEDTHIEGAD